MKLTTGIRLCTATPYILLYGVVSLLYQVCMVVINFLTLLWIEIVLITIYNNLLNVVVNITNVLCWQ